MSEIIEVPRFSEFESEGINGLTKNGKKKTFKKEC